MDWRLSGLAQAVVLQFVVDGQPVVPDAASIHFTAWNHAGTVIENYDFTQPVDAVPTQMSVVMSSGLNDLDVDAAFENRYLRADFLYDTRPYFVTASYRLHRMIPLTVTPQTVRALVGADFSELPDSDIDVMSGYFELSDSFGANLAAALIRSDSACMAANDAIALQVAIKLCPSLQSRLLKSEKAENSGFQRVDMDFKKLEADLIAQQAAKLELITSTISGSDTAFSLPTIFVVTKQTDRITNSST